MPRSLLNKALVAQAVYDNKFLLPFAPEAPTFFLVPGDNQVTVVWQKSETETVKAGGGDPYFAIASDPTSTLYDPNFRQYDVEGYRIYRGRTTGDLSLVAQFDYAGTTFTDFTGGVRLHRRIADGDGISECAPELGVQDDCPHHVPVRRRVRITRWSATSSRSRPAAACSWPTAVSSSSTPIRAVSGGGQGFPALADNGVPFAYVDRGVRNSFTYFYAVTAFDVNSLASGPSSIESPRVTKSVTPRAPGANTTATALVRGVFGADGTELNPSAQYPAIDTATGTFAGNMPPANDAALVLGSAVVEALPPGDITVKVVSVGPGFAGGIGARSRR